MQDQPIDPMVEHINWTYSHLTEETKKDAKKWLIDYFLCFHHPPTFKEMMEDVENRYHWQTLNSLIHQFGLQKYEGKDIFSYASWNHDKPVTYVFLESEFRNYLRLAWTNKIGVIPCNQN
jgi:hypothetical protein